APTVATLTIDDLAAMADAAEAREQDADGEFEPAGEPAGDRFAEMLAEAAPTPLAQPRRPGQVNRATPVPNEDATPSVRPFRPNAGQNVAKLGVKPIGAMPVKPEPTPTRQETSMPLEEAVATIERPRTGDSSERLAATY